MRLDGTKSNENFMLSSTMAANIKQLYDAFVDAGGLEQESGAKFVITAAQTDVEVDE